MNSFDILLSDRSRYDAALEIIKEAGYKDGWENYEIGSALIDLDRREGFTRENYSTPAKILDYLSHFYKNPDHRRVNAEARTSHGTVCDNGIELSPS